MQNTELADIIMLTGLEWGEKNGPEKLNFNKIIIASDQDYDGFAISGLLLNFFNMFPELFDYNLVYRSVSPIIIARKGSDTKKYFRLEDFKKDEKKLNGWRITYIKGLGSLRAEDFKEMMIHPTLVRFTKDDLMDMNLKTWFFKGNAFERRSMLKSDVE